MRARTFSILSVAGLGMVFVSYSAKAVIVEADDHSTTGYTVSGTDLINGLTPMAISGSNDQEGLGTDTTGAALTNGAFGAPDLSTPSQITILNNGASVTYGLLSPSTITEIDSYSGWRDGGRSQQNFIISTSTDGSIFTPLFTVASAADGNGPSDQMVAVTDNAAAPLATGITAIKFDFPSTQNGYVGYREFDIFGTATPEPASIALLGIASLGLLSRRRQQA